MSKNMVVVIAELTSELPAIPALERRIQRAVNDIILGEGIRYSTMKLGDAEYTIHRYTTSMFEDNATDYEVKREGRYTWVCNCPDYEKAPFNLCKHRLAVTILEGMEE
jgi:hypothetical protein